MFQNLTKEESLISVQGPGCNAVMKEFNEHEFHNPRVNARYLGPHLNYKGSIVQEVHFRIAAAHNVYRLLWHFWRHRVDLSLKITVFKAFVMSVLLSGMIALTPTNREMVLLDHCLMQLGRKALAGLGCKKNKIGTKMMYNAESNECCPKACEHQRH